MSDFKQLLLTKGAEALELDDEIALLTALEDMVAKWQQLRDAIGTADVENVASAEELLSKIAGILGSAEIAKGFELAGLTDAHTALTGFLGKVTGAVDKIPDKYKALLSPLSGFTAGEERARVSWAVATPEGPEVKTDRFALDVSASAALSFDAGAQWPDAPAGSPRLLKVEAGGDLKADAKGVLPYGAGTVSGGAGGAIATKLGYYFKPAADPLYAVAVAGRLGDLPDPFHFDSVWKTFEDTDAGLEGIAYEFGGKANANLQVTFADAIALGAGVVAKVGMTVAVSTSLKSNYRLKLRRKTAGAPAFEASLSRDRVDEQKLSYALTAEADLSTVTKPVVEAFQTAVTKWETALKGVQPYLSPGTWLRNQTDGVLKTKLEGLVANETLRAAILSDLRGALGMGDGDNGKVVTWLTDQVTGAIDRASVLAGDGTDKAVDRVWTELKTALPDLTALVEGDPAADLKAVIAERLKKVETDLTAKVTELFDTHGGAALKTAITKAGSKVDGAVKTADDALKSVRAMLTHYDEVIHKVFKTAKEAAESKATARLFREETHTQSIEAEVVGDFNANTPQVSRIFEALTRGSLQRLVQLIDDGDKVPGFDLIEERSSITRFTKTKTKEGLEIVFLNISLKALTETTAEARIKVDGDGNVHVNSAAELKKTFSIMANTREAAFVGTHALVLAKAVKHIPGAGEPVLEVGVSARYEDKTLEWGDVKDFIDVLAKSGVLGQGVLAEAQSAFQGWRAAADGGAIDGEVSGNLRLSGAAIETLLQLPNRVDGKLNDTGRLAIIKAGRLALIARGVITESHFEEGAKTARGYFAHKPGAISTDETILRHRAEIYAYPLAAWIRPADKEKPKASNTNLSAGTTKDRFVHFLLHSYGLMHLVDLIDTMGAIYEAAPEGSGVAGSWDEKRYRQAQTTMNNATKKWLTVVDNVGSFFESAPSKRTSALMSALADLAELQRAGGVILTMTHRPAGKEPQTVSFG